MKLSTRRGKGQAGGFAPSASPSGGSSGRGYKPRQPTADEFSRNWTLAGLLRPLGGFVPGVGCAQSCGCMVWSCAHDVGMCAGYKFPCRLASCVHPVCTGMAFAPGGLARLRRGGPHLHGGQVEAPGALRAALQQGLPLTVQPRRSLGRCVCVRGLAHVPWQSYGRCCCSGSVWAAVLSSC